MTTEKSFYKLVDSETYKEMMNSLIAEKVEIILKIDQQHHKTILLSAENGSDFIVSLPEKLKPISSLATGTFEFNKNKYLFKTTIDKKPFYFIFSTPSEIFLLQRRNDFRVVLPSTVKYLAEITSVNGQKIKEEKIEIRDISLGGCQIVLKKIDKLITADDEIKIKIDILDLKKEIICKAKHVVFLPNKTHLQIGIQFTNLDTIFLSDLQNLLIHLDRIHRGKRFC